MEVIGHRGVRSFWPDNTLASFLALAGTGAAGTEFDVRLTADGECVCLHDATLPDGRRVCDVGAQGLAGLQIPGPGGTTAPVAFLGEALEALQGSHLICEIKNHPWDECYDDTDRLVDSVVGLLPEGSTIACFDPRSLSKVDGDRFKRSLVTAGSFDPMSALDAAVQMGFDICAVEHHAIEPAFVAAAVSAGIEVHAWATHEADRVRALARMGVSVLMADDPASAIAAFGA